METAISQSELIIQPDGTIYHLALRPGDVAETVIFVGDPERVRLISCHFDKIEVEKAHREFVTRTGWIGSKRLTVISTGIGTDNIDIVLNELDALFNIDFSTRKVKPNITALNIFRIGTSGALQPDIPLDSIVISQWAVGLDGLMEYYDYAHTRQEEDMASGLGKQLQMGSVPQIFPGSSSLDRYFDRSFYRGITATCAGFYAPQGRQLRAPRAFPNLLDNLAAFRYKNMQVTNFEMETAGIYGLGGLLGHQCLSLSAIIANRYHGTFSADYKNAIDRMIIKTLTTIESI